MAYLDGELTPKHAASVAAHLEECGECRILAEELRGISRQLLAWEVEAAPERLTEPSGAGSKLQNLSEARSPLREKRQTHLGWLTARSRIAVIGAVGAAAIALVVWIAVSPGTPQTQELVRQAKLPIPVDQARQSRLGADFAASLTGPSQGELDISPLVRAELGKLGNPAQSGVGPEPTSAPMIVRTAEVTLVTKQINSAREGIEAIVAQNKGYIARLEVQGETSAGRTLTATLRVPANQLDAALASLKKLGQVARESQKGEEVTFQYADLQARLGNARRTEGRLIELLTQRTGRLSDVLDVERELDNVRGQIERMDAQRRTMENQVQFAAIDLSVREEYNAKLNLAPFSAVARLRNALVQGWQTTGEVLLGIAIFLLNYGPLLVLGSAVLFWPARWVWRRSRLSTASQEHRVIGG